MNLLQFSNSGRGPEVSASSGNLLERPVCGPCPRPADSNAGGRGSSAVYVSEGPPHDSDVL